MPRVSVIVPAFNCARFLGEAVRSALGQTYGDHEIIVADDGSTDDTQEVVGRCGGGVLYLHQPNRGPSAARNLALSRAGGEFVAYLDADDMWYPDKLERQVAFLDTNRRHALVHGEIDVIDERNQVIQRRFNQRTGRGIPRGNCTLELLRASHVQTLTVMVRREYVDRVGLFDERLRCNEDYLQWILVSMEGGSVGYIEEPLAMYRRTNGSLSSNPRSMCVELMKMFEILLNEKCLGERGGAEAVEVVRSRLYELGRALAYLERTGGQAHQARRRLVGLIRERPLEPSLYVDLLKACVPSVLERKLRGSRDAWREARK